SSQVKALCTKKSGETVCPKLPNSQIKDSMISSAAVSCGNDYINHMETVTKAQVDRAKAMGVTITTVLIKDNSGTDGAIDVLRRLIKQPNYDSGKSATYMAETTQGQKYEAANYDAPRIQQIF